MNYPAIDFMNDMREQFGKFEFRVTTSKAVITSKNYTPEKLGIEVIPQVIMPQLKGKK